MKRRIFYKRNGQRVSRAYIRSQIEAYVMAKGKTGKLGELSVSIQPELADRVSRMTEEEFATYTGCYTYTVK